MNKQDIGRQAELLACCFLQQQGLELKQQNYHSRYGEIDLIMQHEDTLCFIEVRARQYLGYGAAADTVNLRKQQKIIQTAQYYLQQYPEQNLNFSRFDVIAIGYEHARVWQHPQQQWAQGAIDLEWIQHAYLLA